MSGARFWVHIAPFDRCQEALRAVREVVFVREQRVPPTLEWDGTDPHCTHVLGRAPDGEPIGAARLAADGKIGRMAVLAPWRGRGVGSAMLGALLACARASAHPRVYLHAQDSALGFYTRHGFVAEDERFAEAGIWHRRMTRTSEAGTQPTAPCLGPPSAHGGGLLGQTIAVQRLSYREQHGLAMVDLASQARRKIQVLTTTPTPETFEQSFVLLALRRFVLATPRARIQIAVRDPQGTARQSPRLLELAHQLPSGIAVRQVATEREADDDDVLWLADDVAVLHRPLTEAPAGVLAYRARGRLIRAFRRFEECWVHSQPSAELRRVQL